MAGIALQEKVANCQSRSVKSNLRHHSHNVARLQQSKLTLACVSLDCQDDKADLNVDELAPEFKLIGLQGPATDERPRLARKSCLNVFVECPAPSVDVVDIGPGLIPLIASLLGSFERCIFRLQDLGGVMKRLLSRDHDVMVGV